MAQTPRRLTWLTVLVLGGIAVGLAVKTCSDHPAEPEVRQVAPPSASNVSAAFDEADEDTTVAVAVGDRFAVRLKSWAEWRLESAPPFLRYVETLTGPSEDSFNTGSDQWQVLVFEALAPGEGELKIVLGRPWMEDDRLRDYRLTVRATAHSGA